MKAPETRLKRDLMSALERLKASNPNNPDLIKKAKLGKLRISPSTVAREAGCSRTLIGHEGCAYPEIRNLILKCRDTVAKPATSFEEINRALRHENQELKDAVKLAMSRVAALRLRMDATEISAARDAQEEERRLAEYHKQKSIQSHPNVKHISPRRRT
jgi:hypothetical protein